MPARELVAVAGAPRGRVTVNVRAPGRAEAIRCQAWLFVSPKWRAAALATVPLEETFVATLGDGRVFLRRYLPTREMVDSLVKHSTAARPSSPPASTPP